VLAGRIGASRQRLLEGTAGRSLFSAGAAVATNKQYLRPRHSVTSQAARDIIVTVVNRTMRTPSVKAAVADIIVAGTDRRKPGQSRRVSGVRTPQGASIGHRVSRLGAVDRQVRPVCHCHWTCGSHEVSSLSIISHFPILCKTSGATFYVNLSLYYNPFDFRFVLVFLPYMVLQRSRYLDGTSMFRLPCTLDLVGPTCVWWT
jgi:hypothetical protein